MSLSCLSSLGIYSDSNNGINLNANLRYHYTFEPSDGSASLLRNAATGQYDISLSPSIVFSTNYFRNGTRSLYSGGSQHPFFSSAQAVNFFSTTQSFCFKMYRESGGGGTILQVLSSSTGGGKVFTLADTQGGISAQFWFPTLLNTNLILTGILLRQWCSICMVNTGSTIQAYLNGSLVNTINNGTSYLTTTNNTNRLSICYDLSASSAGFPGYFDDFRIYNRAISAAEALAIHNSTT